MMMMMMMMMKEEEEEEDEEEEDDDDDKDDHYRGGKSIKKTVSAAVEITFVVSVFSTVAFTLLIVYIVHKIKKHNVSNQDSVAETSPPFFKNDSASICDDNIPQENPLYEMDEFDTNTD